MGVAGGYDQALEKIMQIIHREVAACLPNPVRSKRSSWSGKERAFEKIAPFTVSHTLTESFFPGEATG